MVRIEFTEEEAGWLSNTLEIYLSHMRAEIARTDRKPYREALKKRAAFLTQVLERLKEKAA